MGTGVAAARKSSVREERSCLLSVRTCRLVAQGHKATAQVRFTQPLVAARSLGQIREQVPQADVAWRVQRCSEVNASSACITEA